VITERYDYQIGMKHILPNKVIKKTLVIGKFMCGACLATVNNYVYRASDSSLCLYTPPTFENGFEYSVFAYQQYGSLLQHLLSIARSLSYCM
jgi:hypothetical protein